MSEQQADDARTVRPSFEQIDALFSEETKERDNAIKEAAAFARAEARAQIDAPLDRLDTALHDLGAFERWALHSPDDGEGMKQRLANVRKSLAALTESAGGAWEDRFEPLHQAYSRIVTAVYRQRGE